MYVMEKLIFRQDLRSTVRNLLLLIDMVASDFFPGIFI